MNCREVLPPPKPQERELESREFEIDYDGSLLLGDSAHHAMIVTDDSDDKWVMKSNDVSYKKARNEIEMLEKFQREGIPTLPFNGRNPFLVKLDDTSDPAAELYLPFIEGLQPLTRLEWSVEVGTEEYQARLENMESYVGLAAKMHRRGYRHGDFQIKNIGQLRSGKLVTFDLENASEISKKNEVYERSKDLISLLKSTRLNGLYANTNPAVINSEVSNLLFKYAEKFDLDDTSIEVSEAAQKSFMDWINDPEAVKRALSRFIITRA